MLINKLNADIINSGSVSLHDAIFHNLNFNFWEKKLTLQFEIESDTNLYVQFNFLETIGFNMTSCDFWGRSPHVLDFEYIESEKYNLLSNLTERKNKSPHHPLCVLNSDKKFWECLFTFSSGDTLRIVCSTLQIEQS